MNQTQIDELERLCAEATPGPWESGPLFDDIAGDYVVWAGRTKRGKRKYLGNVGGIVQPVIPRTLANMVVFDLEAKDAAFIAAARTALPLLLAERQEMQRDYDNLENEYRWLKDQTGQMQQDLDRLPGLWKSYLRQQDRNGRLETITAAAILDLHEWDGLDRGYDAHGRLRQALVEVNDADD